MDEDGNDMLLFPEQVSRSFLDKNVNHKFELNEFLYLDLWEMMEININKSVCKFGIIIIF